MGHFGLAFYPLLKWTLSRHSRSAPMCSTCRTHYIATENVVLRSTTVAVISTAPKWDSSGSCKPEILQLLQRALCCRTAATVSCNSFRNSSIVMLSLTVNCRVIKTTQSLSSGGDFVGPSPIEFVLRALIVVGRRPKLDWLWSTLWITWGWLLSPWTFQTGRR
jgi:hypothetical protein